MSSLEFSQYAIVILLTMLFIVPVRYAWFIILILPMFDASGRSFASAGQVGILNALKIMVAPAIMIFRLKSRPLKVLFQIGKNSALFAFGFLLLYASVATLWSPWKLSAIKMIGYLVGHILWFSVLLWGWMSGRLNLRIIKIVFVTAVGLGILQSYILESSFGVYRWEAQRFTAFLSPQYYAAYIVFLVAILVFRMRSQRFIGKLTLLGIALIVVILTGSRYSFVSIIFVILLFFLSLLRSYRLKIYGFLVLYLFIVGVIVISLANLMGYSASMSWLQKTRIAELRYVLSNPEEIGTLAWRIGMYKGVWMAISQTERSKILIGHGTSSAARIAIRVDPERYSSKTVDANRVVHNEFLRALYEWGVVGLLILLYIVLYIIASSVVFIYKKEDYTMLSALPLLLSGLAIENILASAGSAWGVGIMLLLSMVYSDSLKRKA